MREPPASTLTVAKLKALCVLNDVATSGKKAELVERLLEAGVDRATLGLPVDGDTQAETVTAAVPDGGDSSKESTAGTDDETPVMLSLEDDDTLTPSPKVDRPPSSTPPVEAMTVDEDVLDAEVLDADLFVGDPVEVQPNEAGPSPIPSPPSETPVPVTSKLTSPTTLADMIRQPKAMAVVLTVLVLGAGGWYYLNNQLEPFTADALRYGDRMGYTLTEGEFMASEEYVALVTEQFDDLSDYCKMRLSFRGTGSVSITEGTSMDLTSQPTEDRLGAVAARGGQGLSWLAVESQNDVALDEFNIYGHRSQPSIGGGTYCPDLAEGTEGRADLTVNVGPNSASKRRWPRTSMERCKTPKARTISKP